MAAIDPKRTLGITKKTKKATPQKTPDQIAAEQDAIRKRFAELTPKPIESVAQAGPQETRDILAQRKDMLAGFNAPQLAAMQAQMAGGQQAAQQQRERALQSALAKQGVKGGAAASLQAQAAQQASREKAQMDTDLMLKQAAQQEKALGAYEQGVTGSLDLAQKQQFAGLAAQLAGEQTISAEKIAQLQADATKAYGQQMETAANKGSGGLCCFIFLEADDGVLHRVARRARDEMMTEKNRRGYYKLSEVIVPLMRKSGLFKFAVKWTMVKPMISFGKWKYKEGKVGILFKPITNFWLNMFDYLGGEHPFRRENGEVV